MKNLKMIQSALVILILSVLTGCSDNLTSSGEDYVKSSNKGTITETDNQTNRPLFHTQVRLKPNKSYTFNQANTGLSSFNSIDVKRILANSNIEDNLDPCKFIYVYSGGPNDEKTVDVLSCQSEKLDLKEITIQNTSSSMIDADVILFGTRPVKSEIELE